MGIDGRNPTAASYDRNLRARASFDYARRLVRRIQLNPCFRERHVESKRAGQLLSADNFIVLHLEGHRPGLSTRRGRYLRLLRLRLFARHQAAGGGGRGPAQRCAAILRQARSAGAGEPDRQWPRILRHRRLCLRARPGAQRHRAPQDKDRLAPDQRLRRTLQRHRTGGALPADHAPPALRERRGATGRPRCLAAPLTTTSVRTSATATRAAGHGKPSSCSSASHPQDKEEVRKTGYAKLSAAAGDYVT